jgi:hypothetical protein
MGMKFIRGMIYPNANSGGRGIPWRTKWIYEFWGFCVNGTSSLTVPGGFAPVNGVNYPANFTGGTSLLASGSDGSHPAVTGNLFSGDCLFTAASAPFTLAMTGKSLVMWKPNSNSSEDSIYTITRVVSSTQVIININTGGTPDPVSKHPTMSARTGVNYRVVDLEVGSNAGYVAGSFLVLQTDASSINPGQGNSQIQFTHGNHTFDLGRSDLIMGISGTGSWNGNTLSVTAATNATPIQITTSSIHGYSTGQSVSISGVLGNTNANGSWLITVTGTNTFTLTGSAGSGTYTSGGTVFNGFQNDGYQTIYNVAMFSSAAYSAGQSCINMIADKTFLICHIREQDLFQTNLRLAIHIEIPTRLYPQDADLHPVVVLTDTIFTGNLYTSSASLSYGGGFVMRTHSGDATSARTYRTLVKAMRGDGTPDVFGQNLSDYRIGYNTVAGTIPVSDGILALPGIANQYSIARCRLRTVKFTGTHVPPHHRIGLNGDFIQLQNGICWPWDNTIVPQQLLLFGSG